MTVQFFQDKARKVLVYKTADQRVFNYIPDARPLNGEHVIVPQTLYNTQLMAWLKYPVPPIMDDMGYDWPHNRQMLPPDAKACPTHAQRIMANFMVANPRSFNLSDMGTMKTLATLWALDFLMLQYPPGTFRALIIAKLSTLQRTWGDELFKHFLGRRTFQIVHHSSAEQRRRQLAKPADFYIMNPDGLKIGATLKRKRDFKIEGLCADLFARTDIKAVALDEAGAFRDARSGRSRITQMFCDYGRMPYVWPITGTPTPNAPTDAFGLARLIYNNLGFKFTDFERETMINITSFKKVPAKGSYERAARLLQPAVRFDIADVWDGPPLTTTQRTVMLTDHQRKVLHELKQQLQVQMRGGATITPANEAAVRTKILQIMQGAVYDDKHVSHHVDADYRIKELLSCISEATRKVLVFVPFTNVINMLVSRLTAAKQVCIKLNGEVKPKDRDGLLLRFRDDTTTRVAVCDPQTVSHGLNQLVAATTVVWYGPTDKNELYEQGNARAHRPGQRFPVSVVQLAASALEREIYTRLETNGTMQGVLLNWIRSEAL